MPTQKADHNRLFRRTMVVALAAAGIGALTAVPTAAASPLGALPYGANRIGVLQGGHLMVKEGGLSADWVAETDNVAKFEIAGNRIGVLRTDGTVAVKEGDLSAGWIEETNGIRDFSLTENRIGVLRTDGTVAVKEGGLSEGWVEETNGIKQLTLADNRIGVVRTDGTLAVKEGNLYTDWVEETNNVADAELSGDRIGVLRTDGTVAVKEGGLDAYWDEETNGIKQLALSGDRIGVLRTDGTVAVKEGNLYTDWTEQNNGVKQLALSGDRIGVLRTDGTVAVKEGNLYTDWTEETNGVDELRLAAAPPPPPPVTAQVTLNDIATMYGGGYANPTVEAGLDSLNDEMTAAGITTPARKAAFLATLKHESGFRYNAGEAGNSSVYRGRGFIQITSQANYQSASNYFGHNFVAAPDDAATLSWSAPIARWYWTVARHINDYADALDMGGVGNQIGYSRSLDPGEAKSRCDDFKIALRYYNNGILPAGINCTR